MELKENPSILVAIASYGVGQDQYLRRVISEYRTFGMPVRILVLSNVAKPVDNAEVVVGLPSRDPYSLPFAHKRVLADFANDYDLFIYSEDDVLITERQVESFLAAQRNLHADEIPGFIRSETDPAGQQFITSVNHHFRWLPDTVVERGGELFAQLSNQHSGCFMVNRPQLQTAINSGGFLVPPHAERYGMLETAASDLYTQCGLRRLLSLSRLEDFIVPHLPNKYYTKMGIPIETTATQVRALREIHAGERWPGSLFEPQTNAPAFRWSKNLYSKANPELLSSIPATAKSVLSIGAGSGELERALSVDGRSVTAIPLDGVFAAVLQTQGIETVDGPMERAVRSLAGRTFDAILLSEFLHLVDEPASWLQQCRSLLAPAGRVIADIANTGEVIARLKDRSKAWSRAVLPGTKDSRVQLVNRRKIKQWFEGAGLEIDSIDAVLEGARLQVRDWGLKFLEPAVASRFIVTARLNTSPK